MAAPTLLEIDATQQTLEITNSRDAVSIQGRAIETGTPTDGEVMTYSTSSSEWIYQTITENVDDRVAALIQDSAGGGLTWTYDDSAGTLTPAYVGDSTLVTSGALNSGSISSGFGNIDIGSSQIDCGTVASGTWTGSVITGAYIDPTSSPLASTKIWIGSASNVAAEFAFSGDATMTAGGVVTVTAPAHTLTGTELKSTVVTSSLTSVGTLGTGAISSGFGNIDIGSSTLDCGTVGSGAWNGTVVGVAYGGTALSSYAAGDVIYASGTTTLAKLAKGSDTEVLTLASGVPTWAAPTVGDITGVTAGTGLSGGGTTGTVTLNVEAAQTQITSVGALAAGSIASGFTSISTSYTDAKVESVVAGNLIDVSGATGDVTVSADLSELSTSTSDGDGDYFAVVDAANAQKKLTKANIDISGFNDAVATSITGTGALNAGSITSGFGAIDVGSSSIDGGTITGTFSGNITGNVTGNCSGTAGSATGNAATATALESARTIGGTSFDGTANIAVALSATTTALASARTIGGTSFDGTANIAVALSATATALATARAINGTDFDGTAAITVTSAAGTLTGATLNSGVTASSLTSVGTLSNVTSSGALTVTGVGSHSIGGALNTTCRLSLIGSWGSSGIYSEMIGTQHSGILTAADGDTDFHVGSKFGNSIVCQSASESVAVVAQAYFQEPTITQGGTTLPLTTTVYIASAPTEGTISNALHVASGSTQLQGSLLANASTNAIGGAVDASSQLYMRGDLDFSGVNGSPAALHIITNLRPKAAYSGAGLLCAPTFTEAGSGTHALLAGARFNAISTTAAAAAITNTASVYIAGASSATVTGVNYSLFVDAGPVRMDGLPTSDPSDAGQLWANSGVVTVSAG